MGEQELLEKAKRGCKQSFSQLMEKYVDYPNSIIRKIITNKDDQEDVMQETWTKVWQNLNSFRGESQFNTWVYRIAWNTALNFKTKQFRQNKCEGNYTQQQFLLWRGESELSYDENSELTTMDLHSPDCFVEYEQSFDLVMKTVCESSICGAKELFDLVILDRMPNAEAADIYDIPEGTVKSRVFRLREQIEGNLVRGETLQ